MLSNSFSPRLIPLQPATSTSELYSYSLISMACSCTLLIHSHTPAFRSILTLIGRVLMNNPTIPSTPLISDARPETVIPNTTSSSPLYRHITSAHTPAITLLKVTPCLRAHLRSFWLNSSLTRLSTFPYFSPPSSRFPTGLAIFNRVTLLSPFNLSRQYLSALL